MKKRKIFGWLIFVMGILGIFVFSAPFAGFFVSQVDPESYMHTITGMSLFLSHISTQLGDYYYNTFIDRNFIHVILFLLSIGFFFLGYHLAFKGRTKASIGQKKGK
jgi:hypothetical protein